MATIKLISDSENLQLSRLPPCDSDAKFFQSNLKPKFEKVIVDIDLKDLNIHRCLPSGRVIYNNPATIVVVYSHKVLEDKKKEKITEIYVSPNQEDYFFKKENEVYCYLCNYVENCMFLEHFSNTGEFYHFMQMNNFFNTS